MVSVNVKDVKWDPKHGKCFWTEYWECTFKTDKLKAIEATLQRKWSKRMPWEEDLMRHVLKRLRFNCNSAVFDINRMETVETVLAMAQEIKELWKWPSQEAPQRKLVKGGKKRTYEDKAEREINTQKAAGANRK